MEPIDSEKPILSSPPERVVSLVPSMTESLFDLGLGHTLVGITDYCIYPEGRLTALPRLGGPKNPDVAAILALKPDLVLANREENTRPVLEALRDAGIAVWVSLPQNVDQSLELLQQMIQVFNHPAALQRLATLERAVDWVRMAAGTALRTFCPVWLDQTQDGETWLMTFNRHTYCHDVLALAGGENVFADRIRRYPLAADLGRGREIDAGEHDTRYPRVTVEEVIATEPEVILLPSEPYLFNEVQENHIKELLAGVPAVVSGRVYRIDGTLITWYGTRLALALQELPPLFDPTVP